MYKDIHVVAIRCHIIFNFAQQEALDSATTNWGIKVERVEM